MNIKGGWKNNAHEHCTNCGSNELNSELKQQSMVVFYENGCFGHCFK